MFDTQARVRLKAAVTATMWLTVFGWIDPRGRDD